MLIRADLHAAFSNPIPSGINTLASCSGCSFIQSLLWKAAPGPSAYKVTDHWIRMDRTSPPFCSMVLPQNLLGLSRTTAHILSLFFLLIC